MVFGFRPSGTKFELGVDGDRQLVEWDCSSTPHLMINGGVGDCSHYLPHLLAGEAVLQDYQLVLLDGSGVGVEFHDWEIGKAVGYATCPMDIEETLHNVDRLMDRWTKLMETHEVGNIRDLLDSCRPARIMILFLHLDDFLNLMTNPHDVGDEEDYARIIRQNNAIRHAMSILGRIMLCGRSMGVTAVLTGRRITLNDLQGYSGGSQMWRNSGHILMGSAKLENIISDKHLNEAQQLRANFPTEHKNTVGIFETAQDELHAFQPHLLPEDRLGELTHLLR